MTFSLQRCCLDGLCHRRRLTGRQQHLSAPAAQTLFDSEALVSHTREVQAALGSLSSDVFQLTNSRRGFTIANDQSFLDELPIQR